MRQQIRRHRAASLLTSPVEKVDVDQQPSEADGRIGSGGFVVASVVESGPSRGERERRGWKRDER